MCDKINDTTKCNVRSVTPFLNTKNICPIEIDKHLTEVYGNGMNEASKMVTHV